MTNRNQIWKCEICGDIVEVLHSSPGELVCCGQPLTLIEPKREEEGYEKHLPVIEREGNGIMVKVGSIEHPMMENHYIEWIALDTEKNVLRQFLNLGEKPMAVFTTAEKVSQARDYCNIHGQWATEAYR